MERQGAVEGRSQNVIKLGARTYGVIPQPHAVILRKFPDLLKGMREVSAADVASSGSIIDLLGDRVYDALKIFIPDLMPAHEFQGFPSKQALDDDTWDETYAAEHAPTIPEIFNAFDVAMAVNGGKRLKDVLGNVLGPELLRAIRAFVVAQMRASLSEMSVNSPAPKDGSTESQNSGANDPTPLAPVSEASPSPVS